MECYEQALRLNGDFAADHNILDQLPAAQGNSEAPPAQLEQAASLPPNVASIRFNRSLVLLQAGNFAAGWGEYEWRRHIPDAPPRLAIAEWDGSPLAGRAILLFGEQGLGDILQFVRYAPLVKQRGGRVVVACPNSMMPILSTCAAIDQFCGSGEPIPNCDVQAPLMSLPRIFRTELDSIPLDVPYLFPERSLVDRSRDVLAERPGWRVGIGWQGNPKFLSDRFRSIPLAAFAPLAAVEGVRLFSLQKGFGVEQLADARFAVEDLGSTLDESGRAFCDTAAVIQNLDLVITSDTALAHLAGALGAKVWVALSFAPEWRWLLKRGDSPWYPTMRLFRQHQLGSWDEPFAEMTRQLRQLVADQRR